MGKSRSQRETFYKEEQAAREGLGGDPETGQHGFSRSPNTGLMFKKPGHPTLDKAQKEDAKLGGQLVQVGEGMASFERGDPRLQQGSVSAPRDTDISGALFNSETLRAIERGKAPRTEEAKKKRKP